MTKSDLVRDFITKSPLRSKKGIARELLEKYPNEFKTLEQARSVVRKVTGAHGESARTRTQIENRKFFYSGFDTWANQNLQEEIRPWDEPFQIPQFKTLNIIADLHSVHLDKNVLLDFLKNATDKTAVLINGDLLDSEQLSRHIKGHNMTEYEKELEICHQILKGLKEEFDHVYFHEGNHDFWLERYLLTNAREIFRLRGIEVKELLRLGELGVHHIHNLAHMRFMDLDILHGHQFHGFGAGKFPSVSILDKWQTFKGRYDVKIVASHSHKNDHTISRRSKDGKFGEAWVTPAMCRKAARYNPYAGWDNGWVEVKPNQDGVTEVKIHLYGQN